MGSVCPKTVGIEGILANLNNAFKQAGQGGLVLIETEDRMSLLWLEEHDFDWGEAGWTRVNRHYLVPSRNYRLPDGKAIKQSLTLCVFGSHRIDFKKDPEFGIFLPSSSDNDLFTEIAYYLEDGSIKIENLPRIFTHPVLIRNYFESIIRPAYFFQVVVPFLEKRATTFQIPQWKKKWFTGTNMSSLQAHYEKTVRNLPHGSFVYVGCKEEVYLLCVAKDDDGSPYMQGTYTTSTKPIFYFSNNYLNFISRHEAEKPKFEGRKDDLCNTAIYRSRDVPGFDGKPFIFPQMGRRQNCKNTVFTGEPEVITEDLDKALQHFQTTDFAEFTDIVKRYAENPTFVHPLFQKNYRHFI